MNGWEFRAAQCQDPALSSTPVNILSADWASVDRVSSSLGAAACLKKPVELDALVSLARRHCG